MLHLGDCLEVLKTMDENSVDAVVTDPPYGLSFMGKKWDYDVPSTELWTEVLRVLKPGGHLLSFGGTRTYHRLVVSIENAGFDIRDMISWLYGSGFPKSHNLPDGWGTALKPANEPISLARKPLSEKTVANNVLKWGTGALNIDQSRIEAADQSILDAAVKRMTGNKVTGWVNSNKTVQPVAAQGRWPANLVLDEEAAAMLDEQSGVLSGGASRFFYVAKTSKRERNAGLEGMPAKLTGSMSEMEPQKNFHPTVKPIKLMEYLCRLITPHGGVILDPFMGSGSTGCAAEKLGFKFIGIERESEYFEIAKRRIEHWSKEEKQEEVDQIEMSL